MNEMTLFNTLFDNALSNALPDFDFAVASHLPKVDVKQTENEYQLEMDLPGRTDKDVKVELHNKTLTISSQKEEKSEKKSDEKSEGTWLIRERRSSSFSRRFNVPDDVDEAKVSASFKNGVLLVAMPRKALAAPKQIAIATA